jgi:tight adherence protein C
LNLTPLLVIGGIIVIGIIVLVIIGRRAPRLTDEATLQERLEDFTQKGEAVSLEKIELSQPFTERVIYPFARKFGEFASKFTPQNALQSVARNLELAGTSSSLDPTLFLAIQFVSAAIFGGFVVFIFNFGSMKWPAGRIFLVAVVAIAIGFYFPSLYLRSRINRRQKSVRHGMPDALDLLTICVEAGLGFDAAMAKVSEKWDNELSLAFARVIQEIQLGKLRREALRDMADRIDISEMTSFVAAVIQSEALGVSLAKVLRIQSDQMRIRRRQLAEEEAHKAPLKMLIPMGLLIFPSLLIVLLFPAAMRLMHSALGGFLH